MNAHEIIEKHEHKLGRPALIFLVWFASKHPAGVHKRKVGYPFASQATIDKYIRDLKKEGLMIEEHIKTKYKNRVRVCL